MDKIAFSLMAIGLVGMVVNLAFLISVPLSEWEIGVTGRKSHQRAIFLAAIVFIGLLLQIWS